MMPLATSQIVLLPGLGADKRLFAAQGRAFPNLLIPRWLPPNPHDCLADYAACMAAEVPLVRPLVLGGCSFGGMVAYEMASILRPDALVLIGSAGASSEIPLYLRALARFSRITPSAAFGLSKIIAPALGHLFGVHEVGQRRLVAEMLRDTPPTFLRWACMAIGSWSPTPLRGIQIFAIHGSKDYVLPIRHRVIDVIIQGAGHLLAMTHVQEVNEALATLIEQVAGAIQA